MADQSAPIGRELLGEMVGSGYLHGKATPLLAAAVELDTLLGARALPQWQEGGDEFADLVFAIEDAWNDLRDSWLEMREVYRRVAAESASAAQAAGGLERAQYAAKRAEISAALGESAVRERVTERLRALVDAHMRLPGAQRCEKCGHFLHPDS